MVNIIGRPIPIAKPLIMTFYDMLKVDPYTAKFYVADAAPEADCMEVINAVCACSDCVLGKYTIGYKKYIVPNFGERAKQMPRVMGTFKWTIKYRLLDTDQLKTHTIPGRKNALCLKGSLSPDPQHPVWVAFIDIFKRICVSEDGQPIPDFISLGIMTSSNWPPKRARKRL